MTKQRAKPSAKHAAKATEPPAAALALAEGLGETLDEIASTIDALGDRPEMPPVRSASSTAPATMTATAEISRPPKTSTRLVARVRRALAEAEPVVVAGKVTRASGIIVEAVLPQVAVGTACVIEISRTPCLASFCTWPAATHRWTVMC